MPIPMVLTQPDGSLPGVKNLANAPIRMPKKAHANTDIIILFTSFYF